MSRIDRFFKHILLMALVLGFGCVLGCGTKSGGNGLKTVVVWSADMHTKKVIEKLVNDYNISIGKNKNIYIDCIIDDSNNEKKLKTAMNSGEGPDIYTEDVWKFAPFGYAVPIENLRGGKKYLLRYDTIPERCMYKEKVYTVPTACQVMGLIYNKDLFKSAGIVNESGEPTPPETFDELREYSKKITETQYKKYGIILPMQWDGWGTSDIICPMQSSIGHIGFDPMTGKYDYSGAVPIMKTFIKIKEDGSYFPGTEELDNDSARAIFSSGNIGMKFAFQFDVSVLSDQFMASCDWGVARIPVIDKEHVYKQRSEIGGSYMISSKAKETLDDETLMDVYKFFTDSNMIRELYKQGVSIPHDWKIISGTEADNVKKGWKEFAELAEISVPYTPSPHKSVGFDYGATVQFQQRFIDDVWNGKMTPEEFAVDYSRIMNELADQYFRLNQDVSRENYINKNYIESIRIK